MESQLGTEVASLYRLVGYRVEAVLSEGSVVDLLVSTPVIGLTDLRWGVVCRQRHQLTAKDVADVWASLEPLARSGNLDNCLLITDGTVTFGAQEQAARIDRLRVLMVGELRAELLGLDQYVTSVAQGSPAPYVEVGLRREGGTVAPAHDVIFDWAHQSDQRSPLVIVGPPGSGKTTLCEHIAAALARASLDVVGHRDIPVVLRGRDVGTGGLAADVAAVLGLPTADPFLFDRLIASGQILVMLDGVDEITPAEQGPVLGALSRMTGGRFLATSRFAVDRLTGAAHVGIEPLTREQQLDLMVQDGIDASRARAVLALLDATGGLGDAVSRPLLLTALTVVSQRSDLPLTSTAVVAAAIRASLSQMGGDGAGLDRLFRELALNALEGDEGTIPVAWLTPNGISLLASTPLITTDHGRVRFAHRAYLDVYMGQAIADSVHAGEPRVLSNHLLSSTVIACAVDLLEDGGRIPPALLEWSSVTNTVVAENTLRLLAGLRAKDFLPVPGIVVQSLHLDGIRCFDSADLTLTEVDHTDDRGQVTVLLGDNGAGKSTVLQAIALCALGPELANRLVSRPDRLLRAGRSSGYLSVCFRVTEPDGLATDVTVSLGVERNSTRFELRDTGPHASRNHVAFVGGRSDVDSTGLFVAGYGATRNFDSGDEHRAPIDDDPLLDRVSSLFDPGKVLIDPHQLTRLVLGDATAFSRIGGSTLTTAARARVVGILSSMLPDEDISFTEEGDAMGRAWTVPLGDLSDGYRSTLAWIGHLVVHLLSTVGWSDRIDLVRGVVLVDELDLHLHPKWQRVVVDRLAAAFPNVQFIATTHSPLVAAGASSTYGSVARLVEADEGVVIDADVPSVSGWRADQILASELFGYLVDRDPETEQMVAAASELLGRDDLSPEEQARYEQLAVEIDRRVPRSGQTDVERDLQHRSDMATRERLARHEDEIFGDGR